MDWLWRRMLLHAGTVDVHCTDTAFGRPGSDMFLSYVRPAMRLNTLGADTRRVVVRTGSMIPPRIPQSIVSFSRISLIACMVSIASNHSLWRL